MATTLGIIQPFRYRGYVYDVETELYYLRSRYYKPELGRFQNSDNLIQDDLFCYCLNDPVNGIDESGHQTAFNYYHNKVQEHFILNHPGVFREIGFYKYGDSNKKGRADLVNYATGEVWEVKPHMAGYNRNPSIYTRKALAQLESYYEGLIINGQEYPDLSGQNLHPGGAIPRTCFDDPATNTDIVYWSEGNGILWYEVTAKTYLMPIPDRVTAEEPAKSRNHDFYVDWAGVAAGAVYCLLAACALIVGAPVPEYAY